MPRLRARVDTNQKQIVAALRGVGASVWVTSMVGRGAPDLVVWYRQLYLMELKEGKGELTPDEAEWIARFKGPVHIVRSVDEALQIIGARTV